MEFKRRYARGRNYSIEINSFETEAIIHGHKVRTVLDMFKMLHELGHIPNRIATARDSFQCFYNGIVNLRSLREEIKAWYEAGKAVSAKYKIAFIQYAVGLLVGYVESFLEYLGIEKRSELWYERKYEWLKNIVELLASD